MRTGAVAAVGAVVTALLAWSAAATAVELSPRTIDRTYRCSTLTDAAGRRSVGVSAATRTQFNKAQFAVFAFGRRAETGWPLVDVYAPGPGNPEGQHGVWINRSLCRPVQNSFRLSPTGLSGTGFETYAAERCDLGRAVLVRLRVSFAPWRGSRRFPPHARSPSAPALERWYGKPALASVAVRAEGRPIAYAMLDQRGRTRLVTAGPPRCGPV
jgi:hypothetical protein